MKKFGIKKNELLELDVQKIELTESHPRKSFDMYELTVLAESLRLNGMIQPIVVKETRKGYQLVSGERRLKASIMAGFITVPCIKIDPSAPSPRFISLVENLERKRLTMFEEAEAIAELMDIQGASQLEIAEHLGLSPSAISNKLRLLKLTAPERKKIVSSSLSERQARALIKINDSQLRQKLLGIIVEEGLDIERTEELIEENIRGEAEKRVLPPRSLDERIIKNTIFKLTDTRKFSGIPIESEYAATPDGIEFSLKARLIREETAAKK